jgi:hypothetical protein
MKYIAKKNTWFDEGSMCDLKEDLSCENYFAGIFEGVYTVGTCNPNGYDRYWYTLGYKNGDKVIMRELCLFDEFDCI